MGIENIDWGLLIAVVIFPVSIYSASVTLFVVLTVKEYNKSSWRNRLVYVLILSVLMIPFVLSIVFATLILSLSAEYLGIDNSVVGQQLSRMMVFGRVVFPIIFFGTILKLSFVWFRRKCRRYSLLDTKTS